MWTRKLKLASAITSFTLVAPAGSLQYGPGAIPCSVTCHGTSTFSISCWLDIPSEKPPYQGGGAGKQTIDNKGESQLYPVRGMTILFVIEKASSLPIVGPVI